MKEFKLLPGLNEKLLKISVAISKNQYLQAITKGMMITMPLTLGASLLAIVGNLPVDIWQGFLANTGLNVHISEILVVTMNLMALFLAFTIPYFFAKDQGENGITAAILSLAAFLILVPQTVEGADETVITAFQASHLGSEGIFLAMINSLFVAKLYCFLMTKNLKIKMSDSVPQMVSDSLSPMFVAMIIFGIIAAIRIAMSFTGYGDLFTLINEVISRPIVLLGGSVWSLIFVQTVSGLVWFFGIHPAAIMSVYRAVTSMAALSNREAFMAGEPMPMVLFHLMLLGLMMGSGIGLAISILGAKSTHFKTLKKVAIVPAFFNIGEPLLFGAPIILNPIFFIPHVLSPLVTALIVYIFYLIGAGSSFNPTIVTPWVMPGFITAFLTGGWRWFIATITIMVTHVILYYPFAKLADNKALKEEQEVK